MDEDLNKLVIEEVVKAHHKACSKTQSNASTTQDVIDTLESVMKYLSIAQVAGRITTKDDYIDRAYESISEAIRQLRQQ